MSYCTKQDLIDRFGRDELQQLTDRIGSGSIDDAVLDRAIADADSEIDGYLATRYTLPLSPVPQIITAIACNVARYYLYEDRVIEIVEKRYKDAIRFLESISKGAVKIGVDSSAESEGAGSPQVDAPDRLFDKDTMEDF